MRRARPSSDARDSHQTIRPQANHDTLVSDSRRAHRRSGWSADVLFSNPSGPSSITIRGQLRDPDRAQLAVGALAVVTLGILHVDADPGSRICSQPSQMRTIGDARQIERPICPDEPQRRDMRKPVTVNRRQARRNSCRQKRIDLIRRQRPWRFSHQRKRRRRRLLTYAARRRRPRRLPPALSSYARRRPRSTSSW